MSCKKHAPLPEEITNQLPPVEPKEVFIPPAPKTAFPQVGKRVMRNLYVHITAIDALPPQGQQMVQTALAMLPPDFTPTIVRWKEGEADISFMYSPDFDTCEEPYIQNSIRVVNNVAGKMHWESATNPNIYHGKGFMVKPDYQGFDREKSIQRFYAWKKQNLPAVQDLRKIGHRKYWETEVLPYLENPPTSEK